MDDTEPPTEMHRPETGEMPASGSQLNTVFRLLGEGKVTREKPGDVIGHYRLVSPEGEGGFGVVWLAEQREPIQRRVALKVIKPGMDSRAVVARFEQERQALAVMDHPGVARVYDAGTTAWGQPYFVMEFVAGEAITVYCDRNRLTTRERLELFVKVCEAVQHAHTKGIIHRDIKPSNVLVVPGDPANPAPSPKVIDFGVAKAITNTLTDGGVHTEQGQLLGTPEYMSPEQAAGDQDIDTRTDVYSLGAVLYELLTGVLPFDSRMLRAAGYAEIQRIIREVDPLRPSTRLSTLGDAAGVAERRGTEPRALASLLRRELEWVPLKALRKDRNGRYGSPADLARDIRNYLEGRPLEAGPESTAYRTRKFVRRNRGAVIAAGLVLAALTAGLVGTAAGFVRAERARAAQEQQRRVAEAQRDKAEKVAAFMGDILSGAQQSVALGNDTTLLRDMMSMAARRIINGELRSAPEAEVQLRLMLGETYRQIAAFDAAQGMLEPGLALARTLHTGDHADVADSLNNLAGLRLARGGAAGAEPLYREALAMRRRLYVGDHKDVADSLENLAAVLQARGDLGAAEPLWHEALDMRRRLFHGDHPDIARGLNNLGFLLENRGDSAGAEVSYREALAMRQRLFPDDHPDVAISTGNLAMILHARGRSEEAESMARDSLAMWQRLVHGDHPDVALATNNLAFILKARGKLEAAEPLFRDALAMRKRLFRGDHPGVADSLNNLAAVLLARGDLEGAQENFHAALEMWRRLYTGDHPDVALALNNLGSVALAREDLGEAERLYREALAMRRRLFSGDHPDVARVLNNLAGALVARNDPASAEAFYREALAMLLRVQPPDHPDVIGVMQGLGVCLSDLAWTGRDGDTANKGQAAVRAGEARSLMEKCLAAREKSYPPEDWRIVQTRSVMGGAVVAVVATDGSLSLAQRLEGLSKTERALIESYGALESAAQDALPAIRAQRIRQAAERVARLYTLWNELDPSPERASKAAGWKAKAARRASAHAGEELGPGGPSVPAERDPLDPG